MEMQHKEQGKMYKPYHKKRECPVCGAVFIPKRRTGVYCDKICRGRAFLIRKAGEQLSGGGCENGNATLIERQLNDNQTVKQRQLDANPTLIERQESRENPVKVIVVKPLEHEVDTNHVNKTALNENDNSGLMKNPKTTATQCQLNSNSTLQQCYLNGNSTLTEQQKNKCEPATPLLTGALEHQAGVSNANKSLPHENTKLTLSESGNSTVTKCQFNAKQMENANRKQTHDNGTEHYEAVHYNKSSFIKAISDKINARGLDERFVNPLYYWHPAQAELIAKVNKYLRCLLENTLKLSRYRNIPAADLVNVVNGYAHVLYSDDFKKSGHPYCEPLEKLHRKLSQFYMCHRNRPRLRLVLRREEKVDIISMLHEIGSSVPLLKFSELFHAAN